MKILVVISYFVPEVGSAAHAYYDLARSFVELGHEVTVITSYPRRYNLSKADMDREFPNYEVIDGIQVYRARNDVDRDNIVSRGLEHFLLSGKFLKVFKTIKNDFDVALVHIPPLPLYKMAFKLKKDKGLPYVLNFQDFHPQELTDVGVLRNPLVIWLMKRMEEEACSKADSIVVLTHGGIDYMVSRGADREKVTHIYNGAPNIGAVSSAGFKQKESIEGKFLITYAGILSPFQGLDTILDAAISLDSRDVVFYIVGDGMVRSHLEERIRSEGIGNVKLLPLQDRESYLDIIRSSDLSIVSLDSRMTAPCFPGKTRSIMSMGVPILALVPESETKRIIESVGSGVVVDPSDKNAIVEAIMVLRERPDLLSSYGENGRKFAQTFLDPKRIANQYIELFDRTFNAKR